MEKRKRDIAKDIEAYLKKGSEQSKKWRDTNPDKVKNTNMNKSTNMNNQYKVYERSALDKRLLFQFSFEDYEHLVTIPCYYCGIIQEKGFNGIDRLNSSEPYIQTNCVSCCEMCNMMKGTSGPNVFVHRAEHILTKLKIIQGETYPNDFLDFNGCTYSSYKARAEKKELPFEISQETFSRYIDLPCYMCGKEVTDMHSNGIDRFDNTKGYTLDNIRSCCGTCNYIKKNYEYDVFIQKLCLICNYQQEHPVVSSPYEEEKRTNVKGNKITSEEKQTRDVNNKERKRKELADRYSDEFIKEKAKEIAIRRAEKELV
jgi:hypothetical protein